MAVDQITKASPDGATLGQSITDKIGFYGLTTPIAQRAGTAQGTYTTTMTQSTGWGFLTSTAADAASALLTELRAALVALNLIKGAA